MKKQIDHTHLHFYGAVDVHGDEPCDAVFRGVHDAVHGVHDVVDVHDDLDVHDVEQLHMQHVAYVNDVDGDVQNDAQDGDVQDDVRDVRDVNDDMDGEQPLASYRYYS